MSAVPRILRLSFALAVVTLFGGIRSALADPDDQSPAPPGDLLGSWSTVSAAGPGSEPLAQIKPGPLRFELKAGFLWASVKGGCNSLRASGPANGNAIALAQIVSTRMACPPPQMQVDDFLANVLRGPGSYSIGADGQLVLTSGQRTLALQRAVDEPGDGDDETPASKNAD